MNPTITVATSEVLQHPEVILLLKGLSEEWIEDNTQYHFNAVSGQLMSFIKLLNDYHLSYQVHYPSKS